VTRSSSDWVQTADGGWIKARVSQNRGLSQHDNRALKSICDGAATTVITQRNKDPIYTRYGRLVDGGTNPTLAKLSLARMIAATLVRMWKGEEVYDPGRPRPSTSTREGQERPRSGEPPRRRSFDHATAKSVRMPRRAWLRS